MAQKCGPFRMRDRRRPCGSSHSSAALLPDSPRRKLPRSCGTFAPSELLVAVPLCAGRRLNWSELPHNMSNQPFTVPYTNLAAEAAPLKQELVQAFERVLDSGRYILGPQLA